MDATAPDAGGVTMLATLIWFSASLAIKPNDFIAHLDEATSRRECCCDARQQEVWRFGLDKCKGQRCGRRNGWLLRMRQAPLLKTMTIKSPVRYEYEDDDVAAK